MTQTFTGKNTFAIDDALGHIVSDFTSKHGDLSVERLDGEEVTVEQLKDALTSPPFLVSEKLVVIREASKNKPLSEQIEQIMCAKSDSVHSVIVEKNLDKRTGYAKFLKDKTDYKELNQLDEIALVSWLSQRAKNLGGTISNQTARYLVDRVGANQLMLAQELDKLAAYNLSITNDTVDLLTQRTPQSSVFELLDAAFSGKTKQAISLYKDQRQQNVEPQAILAMLAWQLHVFALVKAAEKQKIQDIAKEAGLNPFVVRKAQASLRNISTIRLKEIIKEALDIDIKLKTTSTDADDALQALILDIAI